MTRKTEPATWSALMEAERPLLDARFAEVGMAPAKRTGDHFGGWTESDLHCAFDLVKDPTNWKMPIDHEVPADCDRRLLTDAVIFFTGSIPEFCTDGGSLYVVASGYYAEIGS